MGGGSGLGGMVMTGMALGAGSAIAHEAVRGIMGSGGHGGQASQGGQEQQQPMQQDTQQTSEYGQMAQGQQDQQKQNPCMNYNQYLLSCLKENVSNIIICQANMDMLAQCERDNTNYFRGL